MTDALTLTGTIATPLRTMRTASGISIVSFRLASPQRRFDRSKSVWIDGETNWYTVTAFRQLADNACLSLAKGDRVVVSGRLRIRYWQNAEKSGTSVEVDAESLGHDLLFGTTRYTRTSRPAEPRPTDPMESAASPGDSPPEATHLHGGAGDGAASGELAPALADDPGQGQVQGHTQAQGEGPDQGAGRADSDRELVGAGAPVDGWSVPGDDRPF